MSSVVPSQRSKTDITGADAWPESPGAVKALKIAAGCTKSVMSANHLPRRLGHRQTRRRGVGVHYTSTIVHQDGVRAGLAEAPEAGCRCTD